MRIFKNVIILFFLYIPVLLYSHEPVFTLGPEIIWKGGIGLESEVEIEVAGTETDISLIHEILYGVSRNFSLTLEIPVVMAAKELITKVVNLEAEEISITSLKKTAGISDIELRGKYRFFQDLIVGRSIEGSFIGGIKLPTGDARRDPVLGTGTVDLLTFISFGYNSRPWYMFGTTGFIFATRHLGSRPGHEFHFSIAMGPRPERSAYDKPDFVFLPEFDLIHFFKEIENGTKIVNSDDTTVFLGPTFLWSYKNALLKGGVQWPLRQHKKMDTNAVDFRFALAIELHF